MKLAAFTKNPAKEFTDEWVMFTKENISGVNKLQPKKVRDHIKQMFFPF